MPTKPSPTTTVRSLRRVALAAALAGCGTSTGGTDHDAASTSDTGRDGAIIGSDVTPRDAPGLDAIGTLDAPTDDLATPVDAPSPTDAPQTDAPHADVVTGTDVARTDAGSCRPYADLHGSERTSCTFAAGSHATATLGDGTAARAAIQHLIILLHENRSLDHYFGSTGHGIEGLPASFTNPNGTTATHPYHYASGCACDITHDQAHIQGEWDHGAMDGFIRTDGMGSFGYYNDADHPFYTWLLTSFSTSDRYFCGGLGDTGHNRHFLWHARGNYTGTPIFAELDTAGVNWVNFYDRSMPLYNDLGTGTAPYTAHLRHDPSLTTFYAALRDPTGAALPQLSIIDQSDDEHPAADIHRGEAATRTLVENVLASPSWPHIALIYTYDEGGGFLDHVPPPASCVAVTGDAVEATYDHFGIRVPIAIVSPYAIPGYVSHIPHSHTSITRLIELLYDLPALTARDANSDALLDMFDFGCPHLMTPPSGAPAAGPTGCPATCASGP